MKISKVHFLCDGLGGYPNQLANVDDEFASKVVVHGRRYACNRHSSCTCNQGIGLQRCRSDGKGTRPCECTNYGLQFEVSPTGSDLATGDRGHPFATLEAARTAVRAAIAKGPLPKGGAVVWLRGGVYMASNTTCTATTGTTKARISLPGS